MISEERRTWLLGHSGQPRVIPSGLVRDPARDLTGEEHRGLDSLDHVPVGDDHPHAVAGHVHHVLRYSDDPGCEHGHQVLVSAPSEELLDHHKKKASICIRAVQPGEDSAARGPEPLHLVHLVERAVASVTGSSLGELALAAGGDRPGDLAALLGDAKDEVRGAATQALARGLEGLASAGVIEGEDIDALDADSLIEALLTEAQDHDADPYSDAIVTTVLPSPGVDNVHLSIKIEG